MTFVVHEIKYLNCFVFDRKENTIKENPEKNIYRKKYDLEMSSLTDAKKIAKRKLGVFYERASIFITDQDTTLLALFDRDKWEKCEKENKKEEILFTELFDPCNLKKRGFTPRARGESQQEDELLSDLFDRYKPKRKMISTETKGQGT